MRICNRNKQSIYYALYEDSTELVDDYGNATGQITNNYADPIEMRCNVSPARGTADIEQFGANTNYTKTIVTDNMTCPIDEHSILWIGRDTTGPYNYVVTQVARSLNSITYAIKEVNVSGE